MRAIVFDVDGVLLKNKDNFGNYLWSKNTEADLGLSPDQIRLIYSGDWDSVLKGSIDTQQYFQSMFQKLNIHLSVDEFIEYWLKHDLNVNTEIIPILESIKNHRLYIGTNQEFLRTKFLQERFEPYFDGFFFVPNWCYKGRTKIFQVH